MAVPKETNLVVGENSENLFHKIGNFLPRDGPVGFVLTQDHRLESGSPLRLPRERQTVRGTTLECGRGTRGTTVVGFVMAVICLDVQSLTFDAGRPLLGELGVPCSTWCSV